MNSVSTFRKDKALFAMVIGLDSCLVYIEYNSEKDSVLNMNISLVVLFTFYTT